MTTIPNPKTIQWIIQKQLVVYHLYQPIKVVRMQHREQIMTTIRQEGNLVIHHYHRLQEIAKHQVAVQSNHPTVTVIYEAVKTIQVVIHMGNIAEGKKIILLRRQVIHIHLKIDLANGINIVPRKNTIKVQIQMVVPPIKKVTVLMVPLHIKVRLPNMAMDQVNTIPLVQAVAQVLVF